MVVITDEELDRYSRQILVSKLDLEGQLRLSQSAVSIIGCGGLGCLIALYLAGAGVGRIELIDDDAVELSNLHRQIAFRGTDLGVPKAEALATTCRQLNDAIEIIASERRFGIDEVADHASVTASDLIVDASDSVVTRMVIERLTRSLGKPWVMASAAQLAGQWVAFDANRAGACYRCIVPAPDAEPMGDCERHGVLGPVAGMIASMSALQTIEILGQMQPVPWGVLRYFDAESMELRTMPLARAPNCPACHPDTDGYA